ncbi:hypothetical protein T439DRAFT_357635 [Meredithblackwellia eburnea MCA 4105]
MEANSPSPIFSDSAVSFFPLNLSDDELGSNHHWQRTWTSRQHSDKSDQDDQGSDEGGAPDGSFDGMSQSWPSEDPFRDSKNGIGRTAEYSTEELQVLLDNGLIRKWLEAYCDYMGIVLIQDDWRATVIHLIDGPGAVSARDLQVLASADSPRLFSLPIPVRCMPGTCSNFRFEVNGECWLSQDAMNDGTRWWITSQKASWSDESACGVHITFGDFNQQHVQTNADRSMRP